MCVSVCISTNNSILSRSLFLYCARMGVGGVGGGERIFLCKIYLFYLLPRCDGGNGCAGPPMVKCLVRVCVFSVCPQTENRDDTTYKKLITICRNC